MHRDESPSEGRRAVLSRHVAHLVRLVDDLLDISNDHARQGRAAHKQTVDCRRGAVAQGGRDWQRFPHRAAAGTSCTIKAPSLGLLWHGDPSRGSPRRCRTCSPTRRATPRSADDIGLTAAREGGDRRRHPRRATTARACRRSCCRACSIFFFRVSAASIARRAASASGSAW